MAANIGVTVKPMDKLSLTGDLWFAQLAEDNANGDKDLGTEIDLVASYSLLDNVTVDAVFAYLVAGDATTGGSDDDADPMEAGVQISFGF
jgi:carbohydrate-selective porin OprB